jgi:hypothetical protein
MKTVWVIESDVYKDQHQALKQAIQKLNQEHIEWKDEWLDTQQFPELIGRKVIFHGCLSNADYVFKNKLWEPGSYCDVDQFLCSRWYEQAKPWLLQSNWMLSTVKKLVENPQSVTNTIKTDQFFVRPNSPLKPFSGRVLSKNSVTYEALDFGFYFDNPDEEIVISDLKRVEKEWRYVIVGQQVITGSSYLADNRAASDDEWKGEPLELAKQIASQMKAPQEVYILDICYSGGEYKLLELNPFSGADLYNCDRHKIVEALMT